MELFDKDYVHFMWDDELQDKTGFFAPGISSLIDYVNGNELTRYGKAYYRGYPSDPFLQNGTGMAYAFFYYDPNCEVKLAYAEGKQIEFRPKDEHLSWQPARNPSWADDVEYRIKPEEEPRLMMTHKELAEWVSKQNGQYKILGYRMTYININHKYPENEEDKELTDDYRIRSWNSSEWVKPTVDIYLRDCKKEKDDRNS